MYFGNMTAAKRTVDHILSYMRSSPTWPYNGGARSWGDAGNNAKWLPSFGTGLSQRGQMHYRSGLNMIPLIEWYRANPDDLFLLEVSVGAIAGQLTNIDADGAASMMWHAPPYMLKHDPHSGDFGLGFFGHSLESGSYYVQDKTLGDLCFLCDASTAADGGDAGAGVVVTPRDSYRRRLYVEPVALYVEVESGTIATATINIAKKTVVLHFDPVPAAPAAAAAAAAPFTKYRVRLTKSSNARPGSTFTVAKGTFTRGLYEVDTSTPTATITWV